MQYLQPYLVTFSKYLLRFRFTQSPSTLYDPLNYLLDLGGKRVRPCLSLMAHDIYKDNLDDALPIAMAVELFHNFSLMHDDIMDKANLRRGRATVHQHYDEDTAILSGDLMLIKAYEFLEQVDDQYYKKAMAMFNKTAIEVCEGQRLDMDFEVRNDVSIEEYIHMISYKTSVLLACSMYLGALVGGATDTDLHHIYEFGKNIGIAFQIQDDILDTFGDAKVGKRVGGDIIQNKKTYLYLKAMELSTHEQRAYLTELYSIADLDEKVSKVTAQFNTLVVKEYAIQVMEAYRDLAVSHISSINIDADKKESLKSFADYLIARAS